MRTIKSSLPRAQDALFIVGASLIYLVALRFGICFISGQEEIAGFWPAAGVLVSALLLRPKLRLVLLTAALICNTGLVWFITGKFLPSLAYSFPNLVQCWIAAWTISRLAGPHPTMSTLREVVGTAAAALIAGGLGAFLGALVAMILGDAATRFSLVWMFSDTLSILFLVPIAMALSGSVDQLATARMSWKRGARKIVLGAAIATALVLALFVPIEPEIGAEIRPFLIVLPLLWIAAEMGTVGVASASGLGASLTIYQTARGFGLFAFTAGSQSNAILRAQLFWAASFITTMAITAIYREMSIAREQQGLAEVALRLNEERSQMALESTSDALFDWNLTTREIVFISPRYFTMLGYEPGEFEPSEESFRSRVHPEDVEVCQQAFATALAVEGSLFEHECRLRTKQGGWIWVQIRGRAVERDAEGKASRFIGMMLDVTRRKNAEAERSLLENELRLNKERLELATKGVNDGIWDWDLRTGEVFWSPRWKQMLGYDESAFQQPSVEVFNQLLHPDDIDHTWAAQLDHMEGRTPFYEIEFRMKHKDGSYRWILSRGLAIYDGNGKAMRIAGSHSDITKRKLAEQALQESEERFRQVVEGAPEGMYIHTDGLFQYINPAGLSMFEAKDPSQISGQSVLERVHPDNHSQVSDRIREMREMRKAMPFLEVKLLRLDGTAFDAEVTSVPFTFEGRDGALVFFHDLTERKQAEQEMRKLEEQFRQAQKMEAVGRLAGGIAHDFNNLLMIIHSYAEMMLESQPESAGLNEILKAAERGASLTGQMLAFSRKQFRSPSVLNLDAALGEATKMLERLIGEDIEFQVVSADSLWAIKADPAQIVQVVMNLCVNARDAMPQGGKLTITMNNVSAGEDCSEKYPSNVPPAHYVQIIVKDTGVGMSKEVMEHMFEPFYTTKPVGKGTGLGLSTVYGIVKQSDGYIWGESEPGRGTSFTILLPRAVDSTAAPAHAAIEHSRCGTETLLVVEDESVLRKSMSRYLRSLGYSVLEAENGSDAASMLTKHPGDIHVLITDVVMPKMNGYELSKMLDVMRPGIKKIFMSGYTDDAIVKHDATESGVSFLQKPFSLTMLAHELRTTIERAEVG